MIWTYTFEGELTPIRKDMLSKVVDRKQNGPLCDRKGERANVAPYTQEAPLMRLSVTSLRQMLKRPLHVEFGPSS